MGGARGAGVRAIVFTDVVGSTRLRSELGDDRADALRRDHDALLGSVVATHEGRLLRWTGDGLKATFGTASAAVAAAIDMQRVVARYGHGPEAVAPFQIRIGVSIGEVVFEDDDEHGVAVIEAARLEARAEPGEILATDLVQRLGQRRLDAAFEDAGSHELRGLDQPTAIVRVIDTAAAIASRPLPRELAVDRRFPLVGRADALGVALDRWDEARVGSARVVLVGGQSGMGKSRLIAQVAERAHTDGARVLAGTCDSDLAVPFHPFAMAFAEVAAEDEDLAAAVRDGAGTLGPLFPARRAGRSDDATPAARFDLFQSVVALVDRLADGQPLVLALDDLQWAAPPTIQLLRHLVHGSTHTSLLLLCGYRPEEVGADHPLRELLTELHALPSATTIELTPLDVADVVALVGTRAPGARADSVEAFARRVCDESAGSPFFVCELLHHLGATGDLAQLLERGAGDRLPVPDSVREVVGQRLSRLPADVLPLLSTAAVVGLSFDLDVLAATADRSATDVLGALEEVLDVALLKEVDAGRFAFAHAILRTTLLDRLSATRLALTHRQVAETIEALGRADHDELAHHWRLGGVDDKAFASIEQAARRDLEALAYESAAERFESVIAHHRETGSSELATLGRASLGHGLALRALGLPEYILSVEEAGRVGRRLGDTNMVVEAAIASVWPGTFFVKAGKTQTGLVELCEDALALMADDDLRRARVLATLAAHLMFHDDRDRRVAILADASATAQEVGDPELIGAVLVAEYLALWDPTTADRRAEIAHQVGRMARASGDVDLEFFAGFFTAIDQIERGEVATAMVQLESLAGPVTASQNFYFGFLVDRLLVSLAILRSDDDLQPRIDAVAARYEPTHADTQGSWALQTGGVAHQAGRLADLTPLIEELVAGTNLGEMWLGPLALARLLSGDRDEATALLEAFVDPPLDYFWMTATQAMAEVAARLPHPAMADELRRRLLPFRDQLGITASGSFCYGYVGLTLAQLDLARGDLDEAIELGWEALAKADAAGATFESVRARRVLAQALRAAGHPDDEIRPLVDHAVRVAEAKGFHGELELLAPVS